MFDCKAHILNTKDHLIKFLAKADKSILVGYSLSNRVHRIYNKRIITIEEYSNSIFDKTTSTQHSHSLIDKDINEDLSKEVIFKFRN